MWIPHSKQNTYKIISYRKSLKETFWKTGVVENSNEFEIHHSILFNNGFYFRKSLIKCSCSYFLCIFLSQGDEIILQWQYISNSNDFLLHTVTCSISIPLMTGKSSDLFFSSASIAWFHIKDCLKVIFIGYFLYCMTNWTKAMANRPQSTPLFCCYNGKTFITILGFLQFIKPHIWRLVCCDNLLWNRLSIMHTSPLLQPNVLTAIQ